LEEVGPVWLLAWVDRPAGSADPTLSLLASNFFQRLSNGYLTSCSGASVQTLPKCFSNNFSRVFQAQYLFSEILFEKENWLEKILHSDALLETSNMHFGKIKQKFGKGNMR
jgi:hypothetical protein